MFKGMVKWLSSLLVYIVVLMVFYVFFVRTSLIGAFEVGGLGGFLFESLSEIVGVFSVYFLVKFLSKINPMKPKSISQYVICASIMVILVSVIMSGVDTLVLMASQQVEGIIFKSSYLKGFSLLDWFLFELVPYKVPIFFNELLGYNKIFVGILLVVLFYMPLSFSLLMPFVGLKDDNDRPLYQHLIDICVNFKDRKQWYMVYYRFNEERMTKGRMFAKLFQLVLIIISIIMLVIYKAIVLYPLLVVVLKLFFSAFFWNDEKDYEFIYYDVANKSVVDSPYVTKSDEDMQMKHIINFMNGEDTQEDSIDSDDNLVSMSLYEENYHNQDNGYKSYMKELLYFLGMLGLSFLCMLIDNILVVNIAPYYKELINFVMFIIAIYIVGGLSFKQMYKYNSYTFFLISVPLLSRMLMQIVLFLI